MIRIESSAATHVGQVRETNQDRALVAGQLAAVADGMGGHAGGDKAAMLAVAELSGVSGTISDKSLIKVVQAANKRIYKVALAPELRGMGTTVVATVVDNETQIMSMVNVGDSRGYQLRDGVLRQVTEDHSLVKDLLRSGRLTEEEARVHPQRNIVTRVLGISEDVDVDLFTIELQPGDRYLLCSDGLTDEVDDDGIAEILRRSESSSDAADELVTVAVQNGGRDNVTVAVVDVIAVVEEPEEAGSSLSDVGALDGEDVTVDADGTKPQDGVFDPPTDQMPIIDPSISTEDADELERILLSESSTNGQPQAVARTSPANQAASSRPSTRSLPQVPELSKNIALAGLAGIAVLILLIIVWLVLSKTSGETASFGHATSIVSPVFLPRG